MADPAALAEAYRRGLLPPDRKAAYEEAQRRGLMTNNQQVGQNPFAQFVTGAAESLKPIGDMIANGVGLPKAATSDPAANILRLFAGQKRAPVASAPDGAVNRYARAIGQMAPAALSPGSLAVRAANMIVPGVASETLGHIVEGTPLEPWARMAGATAGGVAVSTAPSVAKAFKSAPKPAAAVAPSLDAMQQAKTDAYDAVKANGVQYAPQSVQTMASGIAKDLADVDLDPVLHPKASRALQIIKDRAANGQLNDLGDLDRARQIVSRNVMSSPDPSEQFMGGKIMSGIDRFINDAGPDDVIGGGDPQQAADLISNARAAYSQYRKMGDLTEALKNAEFQAARSGSGGNLDNVTRQALDRLRKSGNWTPDEQAALEQAIKGGDLQNLLRLFGRASPEGNGLMQALNTGSALASHGGTLGPTLGAIAAKRAADAMTEANVNRVLGVVGNGGIAPIVPATPPPQVRVPMNLPPYLSAILAGGSAATPYVVPPQRGQ